MSKDAVPTVPNLDPGIYNLVELCIWIAVLLFLLWTQRNTVSAILGSIVTRLKLGAEVKLWHIELGSIKVASDHQNISHHIKSFVDEGREVERDRVYAQNENIFISHRLFVSQEKNQTYDVLIYLVGHKDSRINEIVEVEYYLGQHWGHNVFCSTDRKKRFAIVVSAFGAGFLCLAKIHFNDGDVVETWRYIDFDAGVIGSTKGEDSEEFQEDAGVNTNEQQECP